MRRAYLLVPFAAYLLIGPARSSRTAAQEPAASALAEPTKKAETGSLKVCLRLEDETAFSGVADVRVIPDEGYEVVGEPGDTPSDVVFYGIATGKYHVEVENSFCGDEAETGNKSVRVARETARTANDP